MENNENKVQDEKSFISNAEINDYLSETSKWGKFLAIAGFIGMGLLIIMALFMMFGFSRITKIPNVGFPMSMFGFLYILFAVIYYFPVNYLYQFSVRIQQGLNSNDLQQITLGFQNLKSLFRFMGILIIVVFSIYGLILFIGLPAILFFRH